MNLGLEGKRALVMAGSSGLGLASARELAAEGARVMICGRDEGRLREAAAEVGEGTEFVTCDVSDAADLERLFAEAKSRLGGLDVLVCNAGGPPAGPFEKVTPEQWDTAYRLTLMSVVHAVRLALPLFREAGGGRVATIVSSSVRRPIPNLLLSNVFRPAVHGLMKSLSIELAGDNVQLNCVAPGRIGTERTDELDRKRAEREGKTFEEVRAASVATIPMGRFGEPAEFGRVVAFLLSDAAMYVNGSVVLVDGGSVTCL
jgi:3-oxoacyl-[acyl-carrier protein] reductase